MPTVSKSPWRNAPTYDPATDIFTKLLSDQASIADDKAWFRANRQLEIRIRDATPHECEAGFSDHTVFVIKIKHKYLMIGVSKNLINAMHKYIPDANENEITQAALITITRLMHDQPRLEAKLKKDGFAAFGNYNVALISLH